jgi:hypothetical protein
MDLSVVQHQVSNFSDISWREHVNFQWDGDEVRFVLDKTCYSASSLKQRPVHRYVTVHIILISSQPVFVLNP